MRIKLCIEARKAANMWQDQVAESDGPVQKKKTIVHIVAHIGRRNMHMYCRQASDTGSIMHGVLSTDRIQNPNWMERANMKHTEGCPPKEGQIVGSS